MRISKYELVTEIAMLCDERDAYKRELEESRRNVKLCTATEGEGNGLSGADLFCLAVGRKKVFSDGVYTWREVNASRDEDTGAIRVTTFERFREQAFSSCPASMSKDDFFEYFDAEFRAMYEKQKEQAIATLNEEEADND